MLLPTTPSAVVVKHEPEPADDELRGNDDGKNYDARAAHEGFEAGAFVGLAFRIGHWHPSRPLILGEKGRSGKVLQLERLPCLPQ